MRYTLRVHHFDESGARLKAAVADWQNVADEGADATGFRPAAHVPAKWLSIFREANEILID
jgi:hypothetical protein